MLRFQGRLTNPERLGLFSGYLHSESIEGPVLFVADTGCGKTTIGGTDAARLGVDFRKLRPGKPAGGISGDVKTWTLEDATITLRDKSNLVDFHFAEVDVLKPTAARLPSLLGMDILGGCSLRFARKYCYIERR